MIGLERCADCRRICICYQECVCATLDATGTMRCHSCTDAHDADLPEWSAFKSA